MSDVMNRHNHIRRRLRKRRVGIFEGNARWSPEVKGKGDLDGIRVPKYPTPQLKFIGSEFPTVILPM